MVCCEFTATFLIQRRKRMNGCTYLVYMYPDTESSRTFLYEAFIIRCSNHHATMPKNHSSRVAEPDSSSPAATSTDWPDLAHRELVRRVVASPTFARSERLSTLLTYICDQKLKGRDVTLNEQRIGQAVFGRAPEYDSSIDSIVRTQASRLRQRLDLYFAQEGAGEPVRIVIPKGGYIPVFTTQWQVEETTPQLITPAPAVAPMAETVATGSRSWTRSLLMWIVCGLLATAIAALALVLRGSLRPEAASHGADAALSHPLWSQIFAAGRPTLVVPADSGLVLSHAFDGGTVSLLQYLAGDYRRPGGEPGVPADLKTLRSDFTSRRYTSIVDLEASVWLAQRAQSMGSTLQVRYARDLRPNDLKSGDVILLGASEANPWVELFERNMNFVLRNDMRAGAFSVINKSPRLGELASCQSRVNDPQRQVYGIVAFTPNLSGSGNALLIEGTSMAGTEAAWDFVSDDAELLPFLERIRRRDGKVPHFELLLGTQNMSSSAVHSTLLAWRVTT